MIRYGIAATLGALAVPVLGWISPSPWLLALAALAFVALLPYTPPRLALAFGIGATVAVLAVVVIVAALWSRDWRCASEVHGVIVEHDCGQPPPSDAG
jgi:membrane protein YdbS with pleckstrin-like domain